MQTPFLHINAFCIFVPSTNVSGVDLAILFGLLGEGN